MTTKPLNQYTDICRDAIKSSSAKLSKTFENLLIEILLLYIVIQGKINFTQMERYGSHDEQTYRNNFGLNVYDGPRTGKRRRPKIKDGKIDMKKLFLSNDITLSGEEVLLYDRTRLSSVEFLTNY